MNIPYKRFQRLVLKYLHTVSQALTFHLSETVGQIKASDKFESVLKVTAENVCRAQKNAASFWAKVCRVELLKNYRFNSAIGKNFFVAPRMHPYLKNSKILLRIDVRTLYSLLH